MHKSIIIAIVIMSAALFAAGYGIRSNPIEISKEAFEIILLSCGAAKGVSDLKYVTIDRMPPYRWDAHCVNGDVLRSTL